MLPLIAIIILGLIIGSFINVLSYRLPKNLPIVLSRSFCPNCKTNIPLYRNIPILTYILQTGKCHNCKQIINLQYPIVELLTSIIFCLGFMQSWEISNYIIFLFISSILITVSIIDFKTFTIPLSLIVFLMILDLIFIYLNLDSKKDMLLGFTVGIGYLGIPFIITSLIYKKQTLGYGDLLLIGLLGVWLGLINIFLCILISCIIGLLIWAIQYLIGKPVNKLPFGTYLSLTAIALKIAGINTYIENLLF